MIVIKNRLNTVTLFLVGMMFDGIIGDHMQEHVRWFELSVKPRRRHSSSTDLDNHATIPRVFESRDGRHQDLLSGGIYAPLMWSGFRPTTDEYVTRIPTRPSSAIHPNCTVTALTAGPSWTNRNLSLKNVDFTWRKTSTSKSTNPRKYWTSTFPSRSGTSSYNMPSSECSSFTGVSGRLRRRSRLLPTTRWIRFNLYIRVTIPTNKHWSDVVLTASIRNGFHTCCVRNMPSDLDLCPMIKEQHMNVADGEEPMEVDDPETLMEVDFNHYLIHSLNR